MPLNTRVFIEPEIKHSKGRTIRPDLLVCRNSMVVAFVELKYLPRFTYSGKELGGFTKDVKSLICLSEAEGEYVHARYQGAFKPPGFETFKFSANTLLVWGGVYSAKEKESRVKEIVELAEKHPVLESKRQSRRPTHTFCQHLGKDFLPSPNRCGPDTDATPFLTEKFASSRNCTGEP